MVNSQLKSIISSYGAEQLHPVSPGEYAYIAGRGIRFHNFLKGTSRMFWPSLWSTGERPALAIPNREIAQSNDVVKSTRDLFRGIRSTSTPNTSITSHAHVSDLSTNSAENLLGEQEGSIASSVQTTHQSGSTTHRGAPNTASRKSHSFNPFHKLGKQINPASINVMATCVASRVFAFGEKRLNPAIHIHDAQSFQHIATFTNTTTIEYTYLSFSRDGKFLVALGSIPDFSITVWNVETREVVASVTGSSQTTSITFNPRDSTQLCSSGANGHLIFWTVSAGSMRAHEPTLSTSDLIDSTHMLCHAWGRNSDIFVGAENGDILYFPTIHDIGDLMSPDQIEGTEPISSLTISKYHLITGSADGFIRFYSLDTKEFCRQFHVTNDQNQFQDMSFDDEDADDNESTELWRMKKRNIGNSDICSIILNPTYDTLVVGCAGGSLYEITLKNYADRSTIASDPKLNNMAITSQLVNDSHCGSVNGICFLKCKSGGKLITAGEDGSVRVWNYRRGVLEFKLLFNASFTAMNVLNNLVFVGSSKGYLRLIDIGDSDAPKVLFCTRLRSSPIQQIDVDSKGNIIILFKDNYVGVLMLENDAASNSEFPLSSLIHETLDYRLYLAGFIKSDYEITSVKLTSQQTVYVATNDCSLMLFKIPKKTLFAAAPDFLLSTEVLNQKKWKLDYPALDVAVLPGSTGEIVVFSLDKSVKLYDVSNASSLSTVSPLQEVESHLKSNGVCISCSPEGSYFASGSDDGILWIRNLKTGFDVDREPNREGCFFLYCNNPAEGGVKRICFGNEDDNHLVFSCGGDGTVLVIDVTSNTSSSMDEFSGPIMPVVVQEKPEVFMATESYGVDSDAQNLVTDPSSHTKGSRFLSAEAKEQCEKMLKKLQEEFDAIREENEGAPDDEKLSEDEFIFDREYVESIETVHNQQVSEFKEQLKNDNLKNELLTERIIEECVKSVDQRSETISGLIDTKLHVVNYVMPKVDTEKVKLLEKIKFMRRVEESDLIARRKLAILRDLEGGTPGEDNSNNQETRQNFATEEDEINEETHHFHTYVMPEYDIKHRARVEIPQNTMDALLYSKFDLYTRQRKISQMWLLHGQIQQIKSKFNLDFKELQALRSTVLNKVERVNTLIIDIVNDLEYNPDDYTYKFDNSIFNILEVKDEEVKAEKWIDPKELARRKEEERKKREAMENSKEAEIIERALNMMMDGRLEDKSKKKSAAEEIPRPSCYDKPADELSDAEKKAILEYEKAIKELEEEETKKRKQLEAKLKNAQHEIVESCNSFDQKLREMFNNKLHANHKIYEIELAIIKLSQSVLDYEDNMFQQLQQKRVELQLEQQNTEFVQTVQQFEKALHEYTRSCDEIAHTIAELERSFKDNIIQFIKQYQQQHIAEYSTKDLQDISEKLAKIYPRSKSLKLKVPSRQEFAQRTQADPDPFVDVTAEKEWIPPILNQAVKKPDNVADWLWRKFLELRREKILLEFDLVVKTQDLERRKVEGARLREHTRNLEEIISKQIKERNKFNEKVLREQYNLDVLFSFKQGQIEVEQQAVVTDYGDAILISKQNIVDLNRLIINQATQNIEQMQSIMDQTKTIAQITWENEALQFEAEEKEDIYSRFLRLRVTKEMQSFLKTGQSSQERDRERLVAQIQHTQQIRDVRVKEKKKAAIKIRKSMERTAAENATLETQLAQLQKLVEEREEIFHLQSTSTAKEKTDVKMKELRMERKLQDLSKMQVEEINQLKQTIQVLRERTFPSFALSQKKPGI